MTLLLIHDLRAPAPALDTLQQLISSNAIHGGTRPSPLPGPVQTDFAAMKMKIGVCVRGGVIV